MELGQFVHGNSLALEWTVPCLIQLCFRLNCLPHLSLSHSYSFALASPDFDLICMFHLQIVPESKNYYLRFNSSPDKTTNGLRIQYSTLLCVLKGFLSAWITFACWIKLLLESKHLGQILHANSLAVEWTAPWFIQVFFLLKNCLEKLCRRRSGSAWESFWISNKGKYSGRRPPCINQETKM